MNESSSIASVNAPPTVLRFAFLDSQRRVGLFNPSTKLVRTIWSLSVGWRDKRDVLKFVNRKESWRFPVQVAAWQLSEALSRYQHLQCNCVEMRPWGSHNRLVAPGTRRCREATHYLSTEVRSVVADDHVLVKALSQHGCCIELLQVIFAVSGTVERLGNETWRKGDCCTGMSSRHSRERRKWSYCRVDSWKSRCTSSRAAGALGGRSGCWSGLGWNSRPLGAASVVLSSSAAPGSTSYSGSAILQNAYIDSMQKKWIYEVFLVDAHGKIVNQFSKNVLVDGVIDM